MKQLILGVVVFGAAVLSTYAQAPADPSAALSTAAAPSAYQLVERGQHHKIWERVDYEVTPDGQRRPHSHRYTELATGLSYWDGKQWTDSQELIEPVPGGAIAQHGNHKVSFANNLADTGAIDLQTPDGKHLRSTIIGLSYFDTATGQSVMIAEVKNCQGKIIGPNQVLYENAFDDVDCSVRYTYTKSGFEQDVIVNAQLPAPAQYGLNPESTVLQVLTEFFTPPQPGKTLHWLRFNSGATLEDEDLDFGAMKFVRGRAFSRGQAGPGNDVPVSRQWLNLDNRDVLVEQISLPDLQPQLNALPQSEGASSKSGSSSVHRTASMQRVLPTRRAGPQSPSSVRSMETAQAGPGRRSYDSAAPAMQVASLSQNNPCVVIDYTTVSTSATNFVFTAAGWAGTYFISGTVNFCGTTVFKGNAILKYASGASINLVSSAGPAQAVFRSTAYQPVNFTSAYDNSMGETIYSGSPSGYYASPALAFPPASTQTVAYARFAYAKQAISAPGAVLNLSHCQIIKCQSALGFNNTTNYAANILFAANLTNFIVSGASVCQVENATFDSSLYLASASASGSTLSLTNCLLASVTNLATSSLQPVGDYNGFYKSQSFGADTFGSDVNPFQVVGAGSHYMTNAAFCNQGTTNITPALLADLAKMTTYPPQVYTSQIITGPTSLARQATRDLGPSLSLGYHYAPLDYCFGGCDLNTNLTFAPGTAVGWFQVSSGYNHAGQAIHVNTNLTLSFDGRAENLCYWAQALTVQEGGNGMWPVLDAAGSIIGSTDSASGRNIAPSPQVYARFTRFSCSPGHLNYFRDSYGYLIVRLRDCELWSGSTGGYYTSYYATNCLWDTLDFGINEGLPGNEMSFQNCTFKGGTAYLNPTVATIRTSIHNCAFDGTTINFGTRYINPVDISYNAFLLSSNRFSGYTNGDVIVSNSFNWQSGPSGNYYQTTDSVLINKGTNTADLLGLYHYTTQTNQVEETNSLVDIGYHYLALIPPVILTQPCSQTTALGQTVSFSVLAAGTAPMTYQWYFAQAPILSATNATLALTNVQTSNKGNFMVVVSNPWGSAASSNAVLSVNFPPTISSQPAGQIVGQGTAVGFSVGAASSSSIAYQWRLNGTNIARATQKSYAISSAQLADAGNYSVYLSNALGSVLSANACLKVTNAPPVITQQPASLTVTQGANAVFSVAAVGAVPLSYQWQLNGANIGGATLKSYTLTNARNADGGRYSVVITNVAGSVTSSNAALTVNTPPTIINQPVSLRACMESPGFDEFGKLDHDE